MATGYCALNEKYFSAPQYAHVVFRPTLMISRWPGLFLTILTENVIEKLFARVNKMDGYMVKI